MFFPSGQPEQSSYRESLSTSYFHSTVLCAQVPGLGALKRLADLIVSPSARLPAPSARNWDQQLTECVTQAISPSVSVPNHSEPHLTL